MTKIKKIGLLSLALLGCLVALNASAETGDTKQVSLTLSGGNNTCTIENYNFGRFNVSTTDQELDALTGAITCTFLKNSAQVIALELADLHATEDDIAASNFNFAVAAANSVGLISNLSAKSTTTFPGPVAIYTKEENKLGSWISVLTIDGIIPGGKPAGSYAGNLDLLIQPGNWTSGS